MADDRPAERVLIKICGITNVDDALLAAEAGADAVGFVFAPSPRQVDAAHVREITQRLPESVSRVGLFVDAPVTTVLACAEVTGITCVQLHGAESPREVAAIARGVGAPKGAGAWPLVVKAFRLRSAGELAQLADYQAADAFLIDAYVEGVAGGTGALGDWQLAAAAKGFGKPVILAGGLRPENVATAIAQVAPLGVDVSSGVEAAPGRKDAAKIRTFIARARIRSQTS